MPVRLPSFSVADPNEVLRPVNPAFVALTLVVALVMNLLPLGVTALMLRPDFLALALLYWCIQAPRYVGVSVAWVMGLFMDVGDATVFGQHALAYAFLAYAAEYFRRRVLRFPLWQQAAQVAVLLMLCWCRRCSRFRSGRCARRRAFDSAGQRVQSELHEPFTPGPSPHRTGATSTHFSRLREKSRG